MEKPQFIRGDCDWGTDQVMNELEARNYSYLFKLKKSSNVEKLTPVDPYYSVVWVD